MAEPRPPTYRDIGVEDVDKAVTRWFDWTVDSHVIDQDKQRRKVPVTFASKERWLTARSKTGLRDKAGKLILPIVSVRRVGIDPVNGMMALGSNVPRLQLSRKVDGRTNELKNALAMRTLAGRAAVGKTVYEVTTIPFPFNGVVTYEVTVQMQHMGQMNDFMEKMLSCLEFYDVPCFVAMLNGSKPEALPTDTTEFVAAEDSQFEDRPPLSDYYVVGYLSGDISDQGNMQDFTDQERIVENSFQLTVPTCLHLDPEGKRPAVQTQLTAFEVGFSDERACFVDDPEDIERIFGRVDLATLRTRR